MYKYQTQHLSTSDVRKENELDGLEKWRDKLHKQEDLSLDVTRLC